MKRAFLLWFLTAFFLARVFGQVMAGIYHPQFLPPWIEWYSGLMPYPWLLGVQLLLLMFMAVVNTDNVRGQGSFHVESPPARRRLRWFARVYSLIMMLRYALRMAWVPEARWFGGSIPIMFHLMLAAWLFVLAAPRQDAARAPS